MESARDADPLVPGPLERLFERPDLPSLGSFDLPAALVRRYGGPFGLRRPALVANFVAAIDGVVATDDPGESGHIISQDSEADRFVMGLLRACADAVVLGAGTFRRAAGHLWTAEAAHPPSAALFERVRANLGLPPCPRLVLVTGSGDVDGAQPALREALVVTTAAGEAVVRARLPPGATVLACGEKTVDLARMVSELRTRGLSLLLGEGGPSLFAGLMAAGLVDELFVTLSPALFGRYRADRRKSLVDGLDVAPSRLELLSARRDGSHLFLRYAIARHG